MNKEEKKMMLVNMLNCYINETVLTNKQIEESEKFVGELLENIFDTRCCTELCDCAIPDPIDPFAEVDKDTCRKCNNLIA